MSTCSAMAGPPASRAMSATTAARLPPALSPATATRRAAPPRRPAEPAPAGVRAAPARPPPRVVDGRRELVLRRQPIVDGDDRDARFGRDLPALDIVRVEVADHPPARVV